MLPHTVLSVASGKLPRARLQTLMKVKHYVPTSITCGMADKSQSMTHSTTRKNEEMDQNNQRLRLSKTTAQITSINRATEQASTPSSFTNALTLLRHPSLSMTTHDLPLNPHSDSSSKKCLTFTMDWDRYLAMLKSKCVQQESMKSRTSLADVFPWHVQRCLL
jgi:hypothetical protein